jgi:hypothetical protein
MIFKKYRDYGGEGKITRAEDVRKIFSPYSYHNFIIGGGATIKKGPCPWVSRPLFFKL